MIRNLVLAGTLAVAATARADDAAPASTQPNAAKNEAAAILSVPDYSGDLSSRSTLTGDWDGRRTELANRGFFFKLGVTQLSQWIGTGGKDDIQRDPKFARSPFQTIPLDADHAAYSGSLDFTFDLDTGRADLWPGGLLHARAQSRWGSTLNDDAGTLGVVNADSVYPLSSNPSQTALTALNYTQFLSEQFGVTLGRFDLTEGDPNPFAADETDTFGNIALTQPMTVFRTVPQTALGGGVVWLPAKDTMVTGLALDSEGRTNTSGFDTIDDNGTTLVGMLTHKAGVGDLPGGQRLAATWSNRRYTSLDQDLRLGFLGAALLGRKPETASDSWCVFADGWQYLETWEGSNELGWGLFARVGVGDRETNPIQESFVAGIGGKGGFDCRKDDAWGIGVYYLALSNHLDYPHIGNEKGLEAYYSIGITPWMHLTPSVQWIDPFVHEFDTTFVAGIRLQIDF